MAREYDRQYRRDDRKQASSTEGKYGRERQGHGQDKPYDKRREKSEKPYREYREGFKDREDKYGYKDKDKYRDKHRERDNAPREKYREAERREAAPEREDELPYIVMGRNAVKEAIRSGRSIDRILVSKEPEGSLREIIGQARDNNIQVREVERAKLDEMCMPFGHGGKPGNHQGIVAQVPGVEYCEIEDMLSLAGERGEQPFVILLDGVEDPHNLGSIIRSAECAGAHGVVIPKRRSASITAAACKASAGAVEYMKVARVPNISAAIEKLKEQGLWIAGADMDGRPMAEADLKGPIGLVIGNEGEGLGRLVKEKCDFTVSIPMYGRIGSLNAAVAAAVLMYEKKRQG